MRSLSEKRGVPVHIEPENENNLFGMNRSLSGYFHYDPFQSGSNTDEEHQNGIIFVRKDALENAKASILAHEIAHSILHGKETPRTAASINIKEGDLTRNMKEVQAEAVSYIVCSHYGLNLDKSSFKYIAKYSQDFNVRQLKESMNVIFETANAIISGVDHELALRGYKKDLTIDGPEKTVSAEAELIKYSSLADSADQRIREADAKVACHKERLAELRDNHQIYSRSRKLLLSDEENAVLHAGAELRTVREIIDKFRSPVTIDQKNELVLQADRALGRIGNQLRKIDGRQFDQMLSDEKKAGIRDVQIHGADSGLSDQDVKDLIQSYHCEHNGIGENRNSARPEEIMEKAEH